MRVRSSPPLRYKIKTNFLFQLYAAQRDPPTLLGPFPHRSDLIRSLENVFAETARLGLNPPMRNFVDDGSEDETTVMRRLEILVLLLRLPRIPALTDKHF